MGTLSTNLGCYALKTLRTKSALGSCIALWTLRSADTDNVLEVPESYSCRTLTTLDPDS